MDVDPRIDHLDSREASPFEAIEAVEAAITVTRLALAEQLKTLFAEAKADDAESWLTDALGHLWSAHVALVECVEDDSDE
jgi:hypothetical protein